MQNLNNQYFGENIIMNPAILNQNPSIFGGEIEEDLFINNLELC